MTEGMATSDMEMEEDHNEITHEEDAILRRSNRRNKDGAAVMDATPGIDVHRLTSR